MEVIPFQLKNRHGLTIRGEVRPASGARGLAFVQHGLSGHRRQPHMSVMAECLSGAGYTTVFFDATHSFGESDGDLEKMTATSHIQDLEDVIVWASGQAFWREPFVLAGHSLGGLSVLNYALQNPGKVAALAPIATVLSGVLSRENAQVRDAAGYAAWEKNGWYEKANMLHPDKPGKVSWNFALDLAKYDVLAKAGQITAPALICVGTLDASTPPAHQKLLFDRLGGKKEFHLIDGCEHTPKSDEHLAALRRVLRGWLGTLA